MTTKNKAGGIDDQIKKVQEKFQKEMVDLLGNYPDMSNKRVFNYASELLAQTIKESIETAFRETEVGNIHKENCLTDPVKKAQEEYWNLAVDAQKTKQEEYLNQK